MNIYLNSIKVTAQCFVRRRGLRQAVGLLFHAVCGVPPAHMYNDDINWNHGISLAQTGNFKVCARIIWESRAARAANSVWRRRARAQAAEEGTPPCAERTV